MVDVYVLTGVVKDPLPSSEALQVLDSAKTSLVLIFTNASCKEKFEN